MAVKDQLIGWSIRLYRRTPLCPGCGAFFARCLSRVQGKKGRVVTRELDGFRMRLDLTYTVDSQLYYSGAFEPTTVAMLRRLVGPGHTVIDVGANIGYLSLVLRHCVGDAGGVISFEPMPKMFDRLCENVALNGYDNITPVHAGLSDEAGSVELSMDPAIRLDGRVDEPCRVGLITLDNYVQVHPLDRLDLVKIDTDGAEPNVLRGGLQTLRDFRPTVMIELGNDDLDATAESIDLLQDLGYTFFDESGKTRLEDAFAAIQSIPTGTTQNLVARCVENRDG